MESAIAKSAAKGARLQSSPSLKNPHPLAPGGRVRVTRGPLLGLTGLLVEQDVSSRWLLQADDAEGVFVRADADAVELL